MHFTAQFACHFAATRRGQLGGRRGERVTILGVRDGYARVRKLVGGAEGLLPTFCLEIDDLPGENFAEQIEYRRKWYELVDSVRPRTFESLSQELVYNLPILSGLSSFLPVEPVMIPSDKPQFLEELEDKVVRKGSTLVLRCTTAMRPGYTVSWTGAAAKSARCGVFEDGDELRLELREAEIADSGHYTVTVRGPKEENVSFAWVTIVGKPGVPASVACMSMKRNSVKLTWKRPTRTENSMRLWYAVELKRREMPKFETILSGLEQPEAVVSGLETQPCLFRVFAYNEFFAGAPSEPITVDPPEDVSDWNSQIDVREASVSSQQIDFFDESFSQYFTVADDAVVLGRGRFSVVREAKCRVSGRPFALKYFNRIAAEDSDANHPDIARELQILQKIAHPHLVEYFGAARTAHYFIIILRRVNGLSALRYVCARGFVSEALVQALCRQLLLGLQYLHAHNIAHLDVRPENLQVEDRRRLPHLTLVDFGSARHSCSELAVWAGGEMEFAAPEQLAHRPSTKSDLWSLGVFLWVLVFGHSPFESPDEETMRDLILHAVLPPLDADAAGRFSSPLLDLLFDALQLDLERRLCASECLASEWVASAAPDELLMVDYLEDYVERRKSRMQSSFLHHG
ncbi:hypothetical protein QR680_009098 [Steinernema hermaphroditum]|uniref:Protein kinase domain-containing protein n=1 Tax=Steinernema hermaphroditum TaxID=289476 RepID=A0AA39M892_9BILA|nr:hypothetical protein QR680_009098 [Steinernema hermaphroditum]